jgi:transcriptional regulator with XRE-family HTH domain
MFNSIGKKINLLMARKGISGMRLARELGIPASTIKKIRSQEITNPTVATLAPIARYFSVSLEYLLDVTDDFNNQSIKQQHVLPLISWIEALEFPKIQTRTRQHIVTKAQYGENVFAMLIEEDDSTLLPSGVLIVDSIALIKQGDLIITVKNEPSKIMLNQFIHEDGTSYLLSLSVDRSVIPLDAADRLLGVVMEYHKQIQYVENKKC